MLLTRVDSVRAGGMEALTPQAVDLAFKNMAHDDRYNDYLERFRRQDPRGYELNTRAALDLNIVDDLPRISCPTLVLAGESDVLFPPAIARDVAERIPGAVFRQIPQAAHFPPVQNPTAFAAEVDAFLNRLLSRGSLSGAPPSNKVDRQQH